MFYKLVCTESSPILIDMMKTTFLPSEWLSQWLLTWALTRLITATHTLFYSFIIYLYMCITINSRGTNNLYRYFIGRWATNIRQLITNRLLITGMYSKQFNSHWYDEYFLLIIFRMINSMITIRVSLWTEYSYKYFMQYLIHRFVLSLLHVC